MSVVSIDRRGATAVITADSPPVNALSHAVRAGIIAALEQLDSDPAAARVVLRCAGRTFFAGADIKEFGQPPQAPDLANVVGRIEATGKPVIAAIHGTALGGGLEVALGCHYRIAVREASLGLPEVKLGLIPGATGTQRLPRLAGVRRALEMIVSGDPIGAAEAVEAGIIDRLAEEGDLLEAALKYAEELAGKPRRVRDLPQPQADAAVFAEFRQRAAAKMRGQFAPERAIRAVEAATRLPFDQGVVEERRCFQECRESSQSAAMRHLFFAERSIGKNSKTGEGQPREIERIGVVGAGTMGTGIAYSCLAAGFSVTLLDNEQERLRRSEGAIAGLFDAALAKGRLREADREAGLDRLRLAGGYDGFRDADLVIEAVFESMAVKKEVFAALDRVCPAGAVLATNTSTLDIDRIAAATQRPADVVGLHFFSPAHVMRLVEIVRGERTAPHVIATGRVLAKRLGKLGVVVGNCYGFVGNRMFHCYGREAQLLLLEGAEPQYIDKTLSDWGMAMGPLAVADLAGLDIGYKARRERADLPDDPRYFRIADLLVEKSRLGQKTGKGMYRYEPGSRTPQPDPEVKQLIEREARRLGVERRSISAEEIIERSIYALIVEGARILEERIATARDIDVIWVNGYGFPRHRGGPMFYADMVGVEQVYRKVRELGERLGPLYWRPPRLLADLGERGGRFEAADGT